MKFEDGFKIFRIVSSSLNIIFYFCQRALSCPLKYTIEDTWLTYYFATNFEAFLTVFDY